MRLKQIFKDEPVLCKEIKSVKRLNPKKTYLVQVEVGDKPKCEVQEMLQRVRQIFVNNKINNAIYVPTTNEVSWVDVSELNKKEIKKIIEHLQQLIEE